MSIAEGSIGDQKLFLIQNPLFKSFGPQIIKDIFYPFSGCIMVLFRNPGRLVNDRFFDRLVYGFVGKIFQDFCTAVTRTFDFKKFRCIVDKFRISLSGSKNFITENIGNKGTVCFYPANTDFGNGTKGFTNCPMERAVVVKAFPASRRTPKPPPLR